jgi:hypothetical protein
MDSVEERAAYDVEAALDRARRQEGFHWITDAVKEMEWWACFTPAATPSSKAMAPPTRASLWSDPIEPSARRPPSAAAKAKAKAKRKAAKSSRRKNR